MGWLLNLILIIAGLVFINTYQAPTVCDNPIDYKIGSIDYRFDVDRQDLLSITQEAESAWENAIGKELFHYRPTDQDALTIRMLYDERQKYSSEVSEFKGKVEAERQGLEPKLQDYENRVRDFEKRLDEFNKKVESFNQSQDITEEQYDTLVEEQNALKQEAENLNETARSLNRSTQEYNLDVDKLGKRIEEFRQVIGAKPEQGLFDGASNTITLYFHTDRAELTHTVGHELGHALGIEHLPNPDAIMYRLTNDTLTPTADDIAALQQICQRKTVAENLQKVDWNAQIQLMRKRLSILFSQ